MNDELNRFEIAGSYQYKRLKSQFHSTYHLTCSKFDVLSAATYLSLIAYPPYSKTAEKHRQNFRNACVWLTLDARQYKIKSEYARLGSPSSEQNESYRISLEESRDLKTQIDPTLRRNRAEDRFERGKGEVLKACQAWYCHQLRLNDTELSLKEIIDKHCLHWEKGEFDERNFKNRIIQPYRGVIHLVDGFIYAYEKNHGVKEATFEGIKVKTINWSDALMKPDWLTCAIDNAHIHLKAQLVEIHLKSGEHQYASPYTLPLNLVIDVKQ